jgi:hypothetical protein
MKFRTTFFLFVAVILLGGFIWFVEQRSESTRERKEQARRAMRIVANRISYLRIEFTNVVVECAAEDGKWMLVQPVRDRADSAAIDRALSGLQNLPRGEVITASERKSRNLQLSDYGFDLPRAKIVLGDNLRRRTILVGRTALLGGAVYIKDESLGDIIATDTNLLQFIPQAAADLRDRVIFHGAPEQVRRLDVHSGGGFFQIARGEQGQWALQQPISARASTMVVQKMLAELFDLRVEEFIAESRSDLVAYGLDDAGVKVSVSYNGREGEMDLWLGSLVKTNKDLVYVWVKGSDSIYAVRANILGRLAMKAEDLRDRRLMTLSVYDISYFRAEEGERAVELRKDGETWNVVEPKPWKADPQRMRDLLTAWVGASIVAFVDDAGTNLSALGLAPPARTLKFARWAPPADGKEAPPVSAGDEVTVRVSGAKRDLGRLLVKVEQENAPYEILADTLNTVSMDPLFYRDRQVLNLNPDDVLKITLSQADRKRSVERGPSGEFQPVGSTDEKIDPEVIRDLLMTASHLVVAEFVADTPEKLSDYGLDKPRAVLALGLKGEAGLGKAILFGADVGNKGVYAMLRGQDEVFVLENSVKEKLLQDLIMAPAQSRETPVDVSTNKPTAE